MIFLSPLDFSRYSQHLNRLPISPLSDWPLTPTTNPRWVENLLLYRDVTAQWRAKRFPYWGKTKGITVYIWQVEPTQTHVATQPSDLCTGGEGTSFASGVRSSPTSMIGLVLRMLFLNDRSARLSSEAQTEAQTAHLLPWDLSCNLTSDQPPPLHAPKIPD